MNIPLSKEILAAYHELVLAVSKIPRTHKDAKILEGTGGKVSVRDIIAYQIGWGKLLLGWYQSGVDGKLPEMPGEGFSSWDYVGLAEHFYKKYLLKDLDQQLKELEEVVGMIVEMVEGEVDQLDQIGVWSWCTLKSGKEWPLRKWVRVNTVAPYKRASASLRKLQI